MQAVFEYFGCVVRGGGIIQEMRRWTEEEEAGLSELRRRLAVELDSIDPNPDVIGDRKLLRFFRGHNMDIDKATEMVAKYIEWRKTHNVDAIRSDIVHGEFILFEIPHFPFSSYFCLLLISNLNHPFLN
jgi:hypothetical protein